MNLQSGTKFGAYEILASVGARGTGEVHKALDTRLNRTVAIKILPEQLSFEPEAKRRFEREGRILAALNHPHICTLFDIGDQDGIQYLVMEYLEGETLAGRLQKGALLVDDALRIGVDIADALDKAHQQQVVHGNLRPANIMLTDSGAKLLDFGLGKPVQASNAPGPAVETTPGTLEYLPPESLEGIDADERVDLWSFGCVLYEMLTGKKAFGQSTLSDTIAHILKHDPDWQLLPPGTPLPVHELLRMCLARDRNDRPKRMLDITRFLERAPVTSPQHNLPQHLNTFVGRKQELRDIVALLESHRLLTLTGSGGVGKTRLALQVAQELLFDFADGVCIVELATVVEPQLVNQAIATAVGVREEPARPIGETLLEYLESKNLLIVLDNCEHLIKSVATITEEIFDRCKEVKILVTSRGSLGLPAERSWRVPSLSMPANRSSNAPLEDLRNYDAIQLFLDRAQSVVPEFVLTTSNSGAILDICNRLDGIALAIELAAARMRVLSAEQIGRRLSDRFVLLRSPSRTALPRHQSLQATLDWSYDLLSDEERYVFRQLGVFAGGWTLEAAEAVCSTGSAVPMFEALSSLTDKGLVQTRAFQDRMRLEFSETIRQYTSEKLKGASERPAVSDRHLHYFVGVAVQAEPKLKGPAQQMVLEELAAEDDNLRAALAWGLEAHPGIALKMIHALSAYWRIQCRWVEAEGWLTRVVAQEVSEPDQAMKAYALYVLGWIAYFQGKPQPARKFSEQALEMFREKNDELGVARCWENLAAVALHTGKYDQAVSLHEEALGIMRRLGTSRAVAQTLNNLAIVLREMGDLRKARNYWELALQITRGLQDQAMIALILSNLGLSYEDENDLSQAEALWAESLAICRKLANSGGIACALHNLASVAFKRGEYDASRQQLLEALTYQYELRQRMPLAITFLHIGKVDLAKQQYRKAAVLVGFAVSQQESCAGVWEPVDARTYEHVTFVLEEKLGKTNFSDAAGIAHSMTIEQALALARAAEFENEPQPGGRIGIPAKRAMEPATLLKAFQYYAPLKKLAGYVREHAAESFTLQKAADIAGLERTYFSAFFREKTGVTFKYWEDLRRIERAALRLRESDDSISTIANESFEDLTTFERTFRRIMGMAPRDYRNAEKPS